MRIAYGLGVVLVITLAACWDPSKHPQKDGGTDPGTGGSGSCSTCSEVLAGAAASSLCTASAALFQSLQGCACNPMKCAGACVNSLCDGISTTADATCSMCIQSSCASDFANCSHDASN